MMYALAIIRYRCPWEEVAPHLQAHRTYLKGLKEKGIVLVSGPLKPRNGGAILLRMQDENALAALDAIRDNDPYVKAGVAQYELLPWEPVTGLESLDKL